MNKLEYEQHIKDINTNKKIDWSRVIIHGLVILWYATVCGGLLYLLLS